MLGWFTAGFASVALCVWHWYRWQQQQEAMRFVRALAAGDTAEVRMMLVERIDLRLVREWFGDPALVLAARCGHAVELLLSNGADANERGSSWLTALMHAAAAGDEHLCGVLLAHGAHPDARDLFGRAADWWAEQAGHDSAARMLRKAAD
jgi:hypothetical protein